MSNSYDLKVSLWLTYCSTIETIRKITTEKTFLQDFSKTPLTNGSEFQENHVDMYHVSHMISLYMIFMSM